MVDFNNHGEQTNITIQKVAQAHGYSSEGMNLHVITMAQNNRRIDFSTPKYPETVTLKTVGEVLEGEVTGIGEVTLDTRNAGYLRIKTPKGERTFWLGTVLREDVIRENLKKGDYVGIKYLGEKSSGKQSPYKDYDMRIIPAENAGSE